MLIGMISQSELAGHLDEHELSRFVERVFANA